MFARERELAARLDTAAAVTAPPAPPQQVASRARAASGATPIHLAAAGAGGALARPPLPPCALVFMTTAPVSMTNNPAFTAVPLLTHFTRASRSGDALDNLRRDFARGVIRGSTRMIRGKHPAVCLFDAPLAELSGLLTPRNRRRYEPFGVAVDKRYAFTMGARPVIYMPLAEAPAILDADENVARGE